MKTSRWNVAAPLLSSLLTLAAASSAHSQAPVQPPAPPPPGAASSDTTAALMTEYQNSLQQMGQLQVQAIRADASLEAQRMAIDTLIITTMATIDPSTESNIQELDSLAALARTAQQQQDNAALEGLMGSMMTLRAQLESAQAEALQREEVQSEIRRFDEALMVAVIGIDPAAGALRIRIDELEAALSDVLPPGFP